MPPVEMRGQQSTLTTHLTHGPSGTEIRTVPPKDNGGDASSFSPTDLIGAALASCAMTTMVLVARREKIPFSEEVRARVEKTMTASGPRRIAQLTLQLELPASTPPEHRARLEEIARTCPVALSLHPELKIPMTFSYA